MQIVLIILACIIGLIALLLFIALFMKKDYQIEREILINKPKSYVFDYVKYLKNMDHYNKWVMRDPDKQKMFRGIDGNIGFVYGWNSMDKGTGEGEQEIINIVEGEKVDMEIRFVRPFAAVAKSAITTENLNNDTTKVKLSFDSAMKYPMNLMFLFVSADKMLGADMEVTLNNLKAKLEG